jgi:hypothetical protein
MYPVRSHFEASRRLKAVYFPIDDEPRRRSKGPAGEARAPVLPLPALVLRRVVGGDASLDQSRACLDRRVKANFFTFTAFLSLRI